MKVDTPYPSTDFDREIDCVKDMEDKYPQMTSEFKSIQKQQYILFCEKQAAYGSSNISVGTRLENDEEVNLSLTGIWFRMNDKIQRIKNLLVNRQTPTNDEPLEDSYLDLSNYGIMATIVKMGKWGQ